MKTHHVSSTGPTNGINTGEAYRSCLHRVTSEAMQVNRLRVGNISPAMSRVVPNICVLILLANGSVNAAGALDYDFKTGVIARLRSTLCSPLLRLCCEER
jgi:hypothetical protein